MSHILFGEVQSFIQTSFEETGNGMGFRDAFEHLLARKAYHQGSGIIPDFLSWNMKNTEDLRNLIYRIPISVSEILNSTPQMNTDNNQLSLPSGVPVQISMESSYAPQQLIRLPYFSVIYVLKGRCTLHTVKEHYQMQTGELALLSPDYPYRTEVSPEDLVLNIISERSQFEQHFLPLLRKDNILSSFFRNALFLSRSELLFFMLVPNLEIRNIIKHMFQEFVSKDSFSTDMFRNYLQIFYTQIIRSHEKTYQYYENNPQIDAKNNIPAILGFIQENYRTLTLDVLARQFHYSPAYLSRIIHKTTGQKFTDIITELKISEAKKLLSDSTLSITEIGEAVGYYRADYFTHSFRQKTKLSPREYRKTLTSANTHDRIQ